MRVLKERYIPDAMALKYLEEKEKEELKYEQKNALDHLKKFVKIDSKQAEKLMKELEKIKSLRDRHIAAIINFLPEDKEELKIVLHKDFNLLKEEEVNQILEIIKNI